MPKPREPRSPRGRRALIAAAALVLAVAVGAPLAAWLRDRPRHPVAGGADRAAVEGPRTAYQPGSGASSPAGPTPSAGPARRLHYIANVGTATARVVALGYNLIDTGPDPAAINALPTGVRALVWLGDLGDSDCAPPRYPFAEFAAAVDRLTGNPKVYGYFLADEPHPRDCPGAVADIRQRADYIRAHDPSHRSFIVVLDGSNQCGGTYGCEFAALAPARSHVDLVGVDPYPCNTRDGCTLSKIDDTARRAVAAGVPASALVPVIQAFGQTCASGSSGYYRLPSAAEMRGILDHWAAAVPRPAFDYTYSWGRQGSSCPSLVDADGRTGYPDLQSLLKAHNEG